MSRVPRIRFKGFEEDWEQRKLGEVAIFSKGVGYSKSDLKDSGIPIILYGRLYTNYEIVIEDVDTFVDGIFGAVYSKGGEIITPSSGETSEDISIASVVKKSGILLGGDLNIIYPQSFLNPIFIAVSISNGKPHKEMAKRAQGKSVVHLHNVDLSKIEIDYPSIDEQTIISSYFITLDHLITLHQRKLEKLKIIKKSMLENLFPQNGEKTPKIRFSGFTKDWEQRKLGEMYTQLVERNIELLPFKKILSASTMNYRVDGGGAAEESLSNYKRLRVGDIAFEGHTSRDFRYGRFVLNDTGDGILSPRFSALRPIRCMPIKFWKYYIHYEPIMKKILVNSTKSGTMMNELVVEEFLKEVLLVPEEYEQQKMGAFFNCLDHLITLHQSKLEKLQKIKKYMLESMFV